MINTAAYASWIAANKRLTSCQKTMLVAYRRQLNTVYAPKTSNMQCSTLISHIYDNNAIDKICKFKHILYTFVSADIAERFIHHVIKHKPSDREAISWLQRHPLVPEKHKKKTVCSPWDYALDLISTEWRRETRPEAGAKYLDVGCAHGKKTLMYGKYMHILSKNIYGADVPKWGPYDQSVQKIRKFNFLDIVDNQINVDTNTFEVCTCTGTFHHVPQLDKLIVELRRIIKPGGILIMVEHCAYDDCDIMSLDILHMLYGYLVDKHAEYLEDQDSQYANYLNKYEWEFLFSRHNFACIKAEFMTQDLTTDNHYENLFYMMLKNNKRS